MATYKAALMKEEGRWHLKPTGQGKRKQSYHEVYETKPDALEHSKRFIKRWNGNVGTSGRIGQLVIYNTSGNPAGVWWPPSHRMMRVRRITPRQVDSPSQRKRIFGGDDHKWVIETRYKEGNQTIYQIESAKDTKKEALDEAKDKQYYDMYRKISVYGADGSKTGEHIHSAERDYGR